MKSERVSSVQPSMAKPKAEYRLTQITVEGCGIFPVDMLRYDRCCPASSVDVDTMDQSRAGNAHVLTPPRRVKLVHFSPNASKATAGRWESFGWRVVEDSGV